MTTHTPRSIGNAILYYGAFRGGATALLQPLPSKNRLTNTLPRLKKGTVREVYISVGERCPHCGSLIPASTEEGT